MLALVIGSGSLSLRAWVSYLNGVCLLVVCAAEEPSHAYEKDVVEAPLKKWISGSRLSEQP